MSEEKHYPVQRLCKYLHLSRGAYYRWLKKPVSFSERYNEEISEKIKGIHDKHPDMGYRRIRDELDKKHGITVNDKRVLRICRKEHVQSTIKWKPKSCTRSSDDPAHIARNYLNRDFQVDAPNEKWLTDVCRRPGFPAVRVVFTGHVGPSYTDSVPSQLDLSIMTV